MKINTHIVSDLPVVVIDDYYDENAVEKIWNEICFLSSGDKLLDPSKTGSATDTSDPSQKRLKKKNKGIFLDEVYINREVSDILIENRKTFSEPVVNKLIEIHPIFRYFRVCNIDFSLLSYYENSDYYEPHMDEAFVSVCSWFYKRPKKFEGGSLIFENKLHVDCEFNRTVIFPSVLEHAVDPIKLDEEYKNKNFGRYTITQLLSRQRG